MYIFEKNVNKPEKPSGKFIKVIIIIIIIIIMMMMIIAQILAATRWMRYNTRLDDDRTFQHIIGCC